jgi:hypothetical protein
VRSRTSSFTFKDKPRNVPDVARQLRANLVLEGSLPRSDGRLRIFAQLVRAPEDVSLWSGKFDRESKDIFAVQVRSRLSEVSCRIALPSVRSAGTASPRPKYISSGVCPRNAEWGSTRLCSWT